jgi:short-subunit dehydrogenase
MTATTSNLQEQQAWALVTGASAGIGMEFARQLAAQGYNLVLAARRLPRLEQLAAELAEQHGVRCLAIAVDLGDPQAPQQLVEQLATEGIEPEFLVNNAGYGIPGTLCAVDWASHQQFLQVMVNAVCELSWRLMPAMQRRQRGFIINVASVAGLTPAPAGHTLYGASKAFLVRFSESLAFEGEPDNVRVSALCPGFTYSEFHDVTGTRAQVSELPPYLWLQAEEVVRYGLEAVQGRRPKVVAVPGRVYRLMVWLANTWPGMGRRMAAGLSSKFRKT